MKVSGQLKTIGACLFKITNDMRRLDEIGINESKLNGVLDPARMCAPDETATRA